MSETLRRWFEELLGYTAHVSWAELSLIGVHVLVVLSLRRIFLMIRSAQGQTNPDLAADGLFTVLQRANVLALLLVILNVVFLPLSDHSWFTKTLSALLITSGAYLSDSLIDVFLLRRFGKAKSAEGEQTVYLETYRSRLTSLVATILISVSALIMVVRVFGFESMLEAGGVIGFVGVMLALTQGAWAPDLISGLIILNSGLVEEGDVVELDGGELIAAVFKTKLFHTELLNLANNHRVMIPNAQLRQQTINNLSKFASAKGLRESLSFKIGYDCPSAKIKAMFEAAFKEACEAHALPLLSQFPLEIRVIDTGDYAVTWRIFYYTKEVKSLLSTRQRFLELIHERALKSEISLATPILYQRVGEPDVVSSQQD